jgi:nucleoside-diphosphate-sugar epimerase
MRVFVASRGGVIGHCLVSELVARGHQVNATTTDIAEVGLLRQLGAVGLVVDGLDPMAVGEAVARAQPDVIVQQMTGPCDRHAGHRHLRRADRCLATTNRLRTEGVDHLLAAAQAADVSRIVTLASTEGTRAVANREQLVVEAGGVALRHGTFYGSGANDGQVALVRRRRLPLVGGGTGYTSWVHVDDAVRATVLAVERDCTGVLNIVDDEPAPASEWLPHLAECAGAKPPRRIPTWLARALLGDTVVDQMTEGRGLPNAKAKQELGWALRYPSWRQGFKEELTRRVSRRCREPY